MSTGQHKHKAAAVRRKKRTAKHVLKAKEEKAQKQETAHRMSSTKQQQEEPNDDVVSKKKKGHHSMKDPRDAAQYLSSWKHHRDSWKFNKNTQSWLLRHMYEPDKVWKGTFETLLEYMDGLQGKIKVRTVVDAKRRALRYKDYEKSNNPNPEDSNMKDDEKKEESTNIAIRETKGNEATRKEKMDDDDDTARWKRLDSHDKRKEYKRARKVLHALRE